MNILSCAYLFLILSVFSLIGNVLNLIICPLGLVLAIPVTWMILKFPVAKALDKGGRVAVWTIVAIMATIPVNAGMFAWGVKQEGIEARTHRNAKQAAHLRTKRLRMQREALIPDTDTTATATL